MAEPFIGEIRLFAFAYGNPPQGWAECNGQILQTSQNQALSALLGTRFGGEAPKTFALPDLRGRVPLGAVNPNTPSPYGGEETHTLTTNEMPQHTHEASAGTDGVTANSNNATWGTTADITPYAAQTDKVMSSEALTTAGNSEAHSNMQPYLVVNYCIAITGFWPSRG